MTYDDLEQQMHLRFQSTLPRGEQLNMSKLPPPRTVPQQVSSCLQIDLRECFGTAPLPTSTSVASSRGKGGLLSGLRHGDLTHKYLRAIPAWRRGSSDQSSARDPCPQVPQSHPRVAKVASDRSSARHHSPQALQSHPCVPTQTKSGRCGYGFGQKSLSCRRT